jgi:2'-hydroxyisoflavone reductase
VGALTGVRVLVLGGTGFVGRAIVERLLADRHEPVLFNRGRGSGRAVQGGRAARYV